MGIGSGQRRAGCRIYAGQAIPHKIQVLLPFSRSTSSGKHVRTVNLKSRRGTVGLRYQDQQAGRAD